MPSRIDDRWVWLGFGVFLTAAAWRIRRNMTDVVALILIDPVQYAPSRDGQQTSEAVRQAKPEDCNITTCVIRRVLAIYS